MLVFQNLFVLLLPKTSFAFHLGRYDTSANPLKTFHAPQDSEASSSISTALTNLLLAITNSLPSPSTTTTRTKTISIKTETAVDEALYHITRTTQYLTQAANSIRDTDTDGDKQSAIQPSFKKFEDSLKDLANISLSTLQPLSDRESGNRLALVQTVGYFVNESMDALVGKAVVLPKDFKGDLGKHLEALVDEGEKGDGNGARVDVVVRYGVKGDYQESLGVELVKVGEIIHWAAGMLNPAEGKSVASREGKTAGKKQTQTFPSKRVGTKAVEGAKEALEKLVMSIELR